jgi:hypothetical protein
VRAGLVVDRLFDPPSRGQLVGEVPGRLFEGGQLARHLAGGQRSHDQIGQAGRTRGVSEEFSSSQA